jgi:hypothetical protein
LTVPEEHEESMRIGLLSTPFRRIAMPPTAALDDEALRVGAAMEHIKAHGNLDGFPADRSQRVALLYAAARQGLIAWDKSRSRYELTRLGEQRLVGLRTAVDDPSKLDRAIGGALVRPRVKSGLLGAVAGAAACASLIAWLPSGPSKSPSALQTRAASVSAPTAIASEQPAPPTKEPIPAPERGATGVQTGQSARSSPANASAEPQTPAAIADKSLGKKHGDVRHPRKVAHSQSRTGRRARPADSDQEAVAPGYGFGSPFTATGRDWGAERRASPGFAEDNRRNASRTPPNSSSPSSPFDR